MRRASAVLILLLVAGCASERPAPGRGPGGGRGAPADIFISSAGEPFRGASPLAAWFSQADLDQDGRLTLAEFTADHLRFFKTLDLDGNGELNSEEITRYETQIAPEIRPGAFREASGGQAQRPSAQAPGAGGRGGGRGGGGPSGGGPGGGRRGGGGGPGGGLGGGRDSAPSQAAPVLSGAGLLGLLNEPEPVRAADANIDFQVSAAEWTAAAQKRFAQLDQNHDGALVRDELNWPPGQGGRRAGRPGN